MKLTAISMVKNEEDIIERFIRINSKVIDTFVIYDDNSSDRTLEILQNLVPYFDITIIEGGEEKKDDQLRYHQNNIMNWLMNYAYMDWEDKPDFIFPLDADEFIFESRVHVCREVEKLSGTKLSGTNLYGGIAWKTFVPHMELNPFIPMNRVFSPMEKEPYIIHKAVVPGILSTSNKLWMGNHNLVNNSNQIHLDIPLCHFPVRSCNQIMAKALITAHKFSMKKNRVSTEGYHIRKLADLIRKKNYNILPQDLVNMTFAYLLQDNVPQQQVYGKYPPFSQLQEPKSRFTSESGTSYLTKALDSFIVEVIKSVP